MILLSSFALGIDSDEYALLLEKAEQTPAVIFDKEDFSWDKYPAEVEKQFFDGVKAQHELNKVSPSESIPLLFNFVETGKNIDKKVQD